MIHTIIIDDEQHAIDAFLDVASRSEAPIKVVASFSNPEDFISKVDEFQTIDILFLDIEMVPYSGFKLLSLLMDKYGKQLPFDVIFITAFDQYAIKAFSYNAQDYLLKPLMDADFEKTIDKWLQKESRFLHKDSWEQLLHIISNRQEKPDRIAIPHAGGYTLLPVEDIVRCEADRNYTHIIDKNHHTHTVCRTLKNVEVLLSEHGFLRVHHSHIINPHYVTQLLREAGGILEMADGAKVMITKDKETNMALLFNNISKL